MGRDQALTEVKVISLASATERRAAFEARAAQASIEWSYFDACTQKHPALSYDSAQVKESLGRDLTAGEIGCFSSHFTVWEELEKSDRDQLLVLEDDVIIDWPYVEQLCATDLRSHGIDYLRLSYKNPVSNILKQRGFINSQHHLIELFGFAWGTQAYLITRQGARRFTEACATIALPVDEQMDRSWRHGIPNHAVFPSAVLEESAQSSIGDARFSDPFAQAKTTAFRAREHKKSRRAYWAARLERAVKRRLLGAR